MWGDEAIHIGHYSEGNPLIRFASERTVRYMVDTLEGVVAIVLLLGGGLIALRAASIMAGLPFAIVLIFMCVSLWRGLRREAT